MRDSESMLRMRRHLLLLVVIIAGLISIWMLSRRPMQKVYDQQDQETEKASIDSSGKYESAVIFTVAQLIDQTQLTMLKALIGSIHRVRACDGQVPQIVVYYTDDPKMVSNEIREELSWYSMVDVRHAHLSVQLSIRSSISKENLIELLMQDCQSRYSSKQAVILYINNGMVFEPNFDKIDYLERHGSHHFLIGRQEKSFEETVKLKETYDANRQLFEQLMESVTDCGRLDVAMMEPIQFSNQMDVDEEMGKALANRTVARGMAVDGKNKICTSALNAKSYGIFPYHPHSQASCHVDASWRGIQTNSRCKSVAMVEFQSLMRNAKRKKVAFGIPIASAKSRNGNAPITNVFLPNFIQTLSVKDVSDYEFRIYLGFDSGDEFFEDELKRETLLSQMADQMTNAGLDGSIQLVRVPVMKRLVMIWNVLYEKTMMVDGCDYFYQVNDDLKMESSGWLEAFVNFLDANDGYGVAGPSDGNHGWNCTLLTQAMVTKRHGDLFGWLYPPGIKNWTSDRWLTLVYAFHENRKLLFCDERFRVRNGQSERRYAACDVYKWIENVWSDIPKIP